MTVRRWAAVLAAIVLAGVAAAANAAFGAFLPWREEAEAERLIRLAGVTPGQSVAEIGAGTGRFTIAMARRVGPTGKVYSTELSPDGRREIRERVAAAGLPNVAVVEAAEDATNLPDNCCDLVFLRNVYHHVRQPERFAASIARAVRPKGALVLIDFEPDALWLHSPTPDAAGRRPGHGVSREAAVAEVLQAGFDVREEIPRWSGPMWLVVFERGQAAGSPES